MRNNSVEYVNSIITSIFVDDQRALDFVGGDCEAGRRCGDSILRRELESFCGSEYGEERYKFAAYACSSRYSARMRFTAATVALTCASIGASAGVSKTISNACGRCSGGALRMPR